jgi:hypothetical protein
MHDSSEVDRQSEKCWGVVVQRTLTAVSNYQPGDPSIIIPPGGQQYSKEENNECLIYFIVSLK